MVITAFGGSGCIILVRYPWGLTPKAKHIIYEIAAIMGYVVLFFWNTYSSHKT